MEEQKIKILKGRSKNFDIFIAEKDGTPKDITGHSLIRLRINHETGCLTKYSPKSAGQNEVQRIDLKDPDAGNYSLKFGSETTGVLAFSAAAATIEAALNALNELSGVTVAAIGLGVFDVTFGINDGFRDHPLLEVIESDLSDGGSSVIPDVTVTQEGEEPNGIEVVEAKCGHLKVFLSSDDVALLRVANDQDVDLYVRIGTDDLDVDPQDLKAVLDVEEVPCGDC